MLATTTMTTTHAAPSVVGKLPQSVATTCRNATAIRSTTNSAANCDALDNDNNNTNDGVTNHIHRSNPSRTPTSPPSRRRNRKRSRTRPTSTTTENTIMI